MTDKKWIIEAKKEIGVRERKDGTSEPRIIQYWKDIKRSGIKDEKVPWCAGFVGAMLERSGIQSTRFESAKSYETWGIKLPSPVPGCIVVFTRDGGGHVGFVVGKTPTGDLMVLGGNQSDAVNVKAFSTSRVTSYRWPSGEPIPDDRSLQLMTGVRSTSES